MTIWIDTETFSSTPITYGTYRYAADCAVEIVALAYNEDPIVVFDVANVESDRQAVKRILLDCDDVVVAHSAMFDRNVLRLGGLAGKLKVEVPIPRWRCSMVRAFAHGLPGSLDKLGEILSIPQDQRKRREGRALMMLFCKPREFCHPFKRDQFESKGAFDAAVAQARRAWPGRANRDTHPEHWARYLAYAGGDVDAMRAISKVLPKWNYTFDPPSVPPLPCDIEVAHWHRDQEINDRGFAIDLELVDAALDAVNAEQKLLAKACQEATRDEVSAASQRDKLLVFIGQEYGLFLPDLKGSTVNKLLEKADLDDGLRELLLIRSAATTSSTAKYKALRQLASVDGRGRGTIQFDGAARTRRASGRKFQPHNLPSRGLPPAAKVAAAIPVIKSGGAEVLLDDVMGVTSAAIRGCIVAPPGKKLVIADLANIEGRDNAWLAREEWKLQAFRDYDAGTGHDLYKLAYAKLFGGDPETVTKDQRAIGKVDELACGYQGSLGAFITFSLNYGINLDDMADGAWGNIPDEAKASAEDLLNWYEGKGLSTYGLRRKTAIAIFTFVYGWRDAHPAIRTMWAALEEGFVNATQNPGETFVVGRFKIRRDGWWLRIVMPSGRALCYPAPQVDKAGKVSYLGVNQFTHKWGRINTYGGRIVENACQSFARDILYDAMPAIEEAGYAIVLHVHDEVVCEAPDEPEFNAEHLSILLSTPPAYALDMPLAAAGFESYRYRKE